MNNLTCLACGAVKDMGALEIYPYPDGVSCDSPIEPLLSLDCQGEDWRVVTVCHECFHRLDPDMWISKRCWEALRPLVPFEQLPLKK